MKRIPLAQIEKLARWDADYYKSLSDDDCIICLTEKEVYLLGQVIEQIRWHNTRWIGDKSGLDFDLITSTVEYKLEERMTCNQLQQILDRVTQIEIALGDLISPSPDFDPETTVINDQWTDQELADLGYDSGTCVDADKDAIYAGISQLIRYMHFRNVDFFEELSQSGNFTEQINRLKESTGALNIIPLANAFDFATFYINELLEEYSATVDEELLQNTICDLFCIAVNSGCSFNFYDVFDYFAAKVEPTFNNAATTFLDLVQFAISGTFSGDEYYYFATYFQLAMAGLGQQYLGLTAIDSYVDQFLAGLNSPDNDWTIFCITCPTQYRLYEQNFANGLGEWTLVKGTMEGSRIRGVDTGTNYEIELTRSFEPSWRVNQSRITNERVNSGEHGTGDAIACVFRATAGTNVGAIANIPQGGFQPSGELNNCSGFSISPFYVTGAVEVWLHLFASDIAGAELYLDKVQFNMQAAFAMPNTRIHEDSNICV